MKLIMATLLSGLSIYGGVKLSETIAPAAEESLAYHQGRMISDRAFLESEMGTESWAEALRVSVDSTRNNEGQLRLDGTTIVWDSGINTWCIPLPDFKTLVEPVKCNR